MKHPTTYFSFLWNIFTGQVGFSISAVPQTCFSRQWKMFFVSHSCLFLLTCSLNLSPYTEDGKLISQICDVFEVCAVAHPAVSLMGHLVSGIIKGVKIPSHVLLLLEYRDMNTNNRPFPVPFQHNYEPKQFEWSITPSALNSLSEFLECAAPFHVLPSNLLCSGTAFHSFLLEPSKFLALKTIINIFCSFWRFHSTHKSTVWHPAAAKIPGGKTKLTSGVNLPRQEGMNRHQFVSMVHKTQLKFLPINRIKIVLQEVGASWTRHLLLPNICLQSNSSTSWAVRNPNCSM